MSERALTRREFTAEAVLAVLAGVSISVTACSGGSSNSTSAPTAQAGDISGTIGANHGHTVIIRAAQLDARNQVTLTLTTGSGHTHTVALTVGDVTQIAAGGQVTKTSSNNDGHTHSVTFN